MGNDLNLRLSGDPLDGDFSFKLSKDAAGGKIFLKGKASDVFDKDEMRVVFRVGFGVKI